MIWFDVTDIMRHGEPPVGVIRAQMEIGERLLAERPDDIQPCIFREGAFWSLPVEPYRRKLDAIKRITARPAGEPARNRLRDAYGFVLDHGPAFVGVPLRHVVRFAKQAISRGTQLRLQLSGVAAASRSQTASPEAREVTFARGDVYLSVGADWALEGKLSAVRTIREAGARTVVCCYDLIPLQLPHLYGAELIVRFERYAELLGSAADTVLCISHYTKQDLLGFWSRKGVQAPRAVTFKLGSDHVVTPQAPASTALDRDFILFVSSLERRKNHEVLYQAYVLMKERYPTAPPLCVFVGGQHPGMSDILNDIGLDPRVKGQFVVLRARVGPGAAVVV